MKAGAGSQGVPTPKSAQRRWALPACATGMHGEYILDFQRANSISDLTTEGFQLGGLKSVYLESHSKLRININIVIKMPRQFLIIFSIFG